MDLGLSLRLSLARMNWPAYKLAERVGISNSYLSLIMKNKRSPSIGVVNDLAEAFDCKTSELIALGEGQ